MRANTDTETTMKKTAKKAAPKGKTNPLRARAVATTMPANRLAVALGRYGKEHGLTPGEATAKLLTLSLSRLESLAKDNARVAKLAKKKGAAKKPAKRKAKASAKPRAVGTKKASARAAKPKAAKAAKRIAKPRMAKTKAPKISKALQPNGMQDASAGMN